jgi:hypothetical protein
VRPATLHREDRLGGSVPGADDDAVNREDPLGGNVPGADDDPVNREPAEDDPSISS